ncbi:hypothetical protein BD414DRAFT_521660 [Trametes punicea]|nr:hypothetical protein BD414DRAFT_521660 [Trametes punicea]
MSAAATASSEASMHEHGNGHSGATGKAKQTRRRQRLSCVECTRRRQKCDRQIPCGLCVSRGVPQLCRWEPLVARPVPQRPPEGAPTVPEAAQSTIATLSARIATLEEVISQQNVHIRGVHGNKELRVGAALGAESLSSITIESLLSSGGVAGASSPSESTSSDKSLTRTGAKASANDGSSTAASTPSQGLSSKNSMHGEEEEGSLSHYDYDVQRVAVALAQLSLAPQDEYIGMGTIPHALSKLGDPYRAKWRYARSADTTTVSEPFQPGNHPLSGPIQQRVAGLPPRNVAEALIDGYFAERNWQFGLPEQWFRRSCQQMWHHLRLRCPGPSCHLSGGCTRCTEELNPHWLLLVFSVLALAPQRLVGNNAKGYFLKAFEARRLIEDILLSSRRAYTQPAAVHGVVLTCIGSALMSAYLADRGRVSDAWKLTGTALRKAQAAGLHRDPGWQKWETMDKQERELRVLGWWYLVIADRLYSFTLGRPMMATEGSFDVKMVPEDVHGDGSPNAAATFHQHFIGLCEIIGEMIEKCLGVQMPAYATILEIDRRFKFWLCRLHPSLDWRRSHEMSNPVAPHERALAYQRHMCAGYYLCATMILHRPYLMHAPPILPPPKPLSASMTVIMNPSRERCIELAMELVRVMCDAQEEAAAFEPDPYLPAMLFHYAYFVFDGAIALVGVFSQKPLHPKAQECLALIDRAMRMLHWCADTMREVGVSDGEGETASRAIAVLDALRKAGRWDERIRKGEVRKEAEGSRVSQSSQQDQAAEATQQDSMFAYAHAADESFADAARYGMASYSAMENTSIPFLNDAPTPVQSSASSGSGSLPMAFGDGREFSASFTLGMSGFEGGGSARVSSSQGTVLPFGLLQGGEDYDVDWSAFAEIQGWSASGLFGESYQ